MKIISLTHITKTNTILVTVAFVMISTFSALLIQPSTHALSFDLGKTVTTATNNIPIINQLPPLLMNTPTPVVTVTPQQQQQPVASNETTTATLALSAPATKDPVSNSVNPVATPRSTVGVPTTQSGSGTIANQNEFAVAPAHVASDALMYPTNQISPKLANVLFYLGVTGVFVGGCVLFATRPKVGNL